MRILIIKQLFNPEPTAKSLDFARELIARGHQVEVLTGFPSYPLGKIYPGYKQKFYKREVMEGVPLIRVPIFPSHSASGFKRFLNYLSYAVSATFIGLFLIKKPQVCFVYQGAIPAAIPAIILKKFRGIPFLYDINDLWPETVATSGMLTNKFALKIINSWCNLNYRNAGFITVCTPGFKKRLIEKGVSESKLEVVSNWSRDKIDNSTLSKDILDSYFPEDKTNILYAGNLGIVQNLTTVLEAAKQLMLQESSNIQFVFLGGGADQENLQKNAAAWNLNNVKFIPRVESDQVSKYLNAADYLLVHLKKDPLFAITIPSKILAYLKSGKPILMGLEGDARTILEDAQAGFAFEPDNVPDLLAQIAQIVALTPAQQKQLGQNAKDYYKRALSLESSVDKIERNLENLCKK